MPWYWYLIGFVIFFGFVGGAFYVIKRFGKGKAHDLADDLADDVRDKWDDWRKR